MRTLLISPRSAWRTTLAVVLALFLLSERSLASPEWCDVIFKSETVGRVEVQSSKGLDEMFPGAGMGTPRVFWRPPHTGDKFDLILGYAPGQPNQYGSPAIMAPQGPLQGGVVQARWRSGMPTTEVTLTIKDDRGSDVWRRPAEVGTGPTRREAVLYGFPRYRRARTRGHYGAAPSEKPDGRRSQWRPANADRTFRSVRHRPSRQVHLGRALAVAAARPARLHHQAAAGAAGRVHAARCGQTALIGLSSSPMRSILATTTSPSFSPCGGVMA